MIIRTVAVIAALTTALTAALNASAADESSRYLTSKALAALPFSDAVWAGDTLYVAGNIGLDSKTGQAPADAALEAKLVMDAVKGTVERAGLTMDDVVSVTIYCTDLALYDTFNTAYRGYFHGHFPARAFIGVASILRNGHFEVQAIAVRGPAAQK
jgi:2-iminobutanoate/2-iminopropanoate deaminase